MYYTHKDRSHDDSWKILAFLFYSLIGGILWGLVYVVVRWVYLTMKG